MNTISSSPTSTSLTLGERVLLLSYRPDRKKVTHVGWVGIAAAVAGGALLDLALNGVLSPMGADRLKPATTPADATRQEVLKVVERDPLKPTERNRPDVWMRDCALITRAVKRGLVAKGFGRTTWTGKYQPPEGFDSETGWDAIRATLLDDQPANIDTAMILWILTLDGLNATSVFNRDPQISQNNRDWWKKPYNVTEPRWETLETADAVRIVLTSIDRYTRWVPARA